MLKAVVFFCLVVITVARDRSQCEVQLNIDEADWKTLRADSAKPAEKMLCLFKCWHEQTGTMSSEGVIDVEKYMTKIAERQPLDEADKTSIRDCIKNLAPIKTCADVAPSYNCVRKVFESKGKQI